MFYRELLEAYPEAKVVLTIRDSPEAWHRSFLNTIQVYADWIMIRRPGIYEFFYRYFFPTEVFWRMNRKLLSHFIYPDLRNTGPVFYQGYNEEIKRLVPQERLLVYNLKEGWKPLCDFLVKEVPTHEFPKSNGTPMIKQSIKYLMDTTTARIHKKMWRLGLVVSSTLVAGGFALCSGSMPFL